MTIRPYRDSDFDKVLRLWDSCMTGDAPGPADFRRRVLLDSNRLPESLTVTEVDGEIAGFMLALFQRLQPIGGPVAGRGFITAFGVRADFRQRGIATALLERVESFFRDHRRSEITVAPYPPNYFIPGVDQARHPEALAFLSKHGFTSYVEAIAMDALIGQFEIPPNLLRRESELRDGGVAVDLLPENELTGFLAFMEETMPGDWVEAARGLLAKTAPVDGHWPNIFIVTEENRIVGYCQFDGEHFGPFGIAEPHQGKGIGTVLLARTLAQMRRLGHHAAFVLWTGERAARGVYSRLGFQITRRFTLMKKTLR